MLGTDQKSGNLTYFSNENPHICSSCWFASVSPHLVGGRSVAGALNRRRLSLLMSSSCFNPGIGGLCTTTFSGTQPPPVCPRGDSRMAFSPSTLPCFSGHLHPHDALFLSKALYFLIRYMLFQKPHNTEEKCTSECDRLKMTDLLSLSLSSTSIRLEWIALQNHCQN